MKLEFPNGVALFLWENEVDEIHLQDSHIDVTRLSGRSLRILLLDFWLKNMFCIQAPLHTSHASL